MKNYTTEDIIYLAGFFDGEGHIGLSSKSTGCYTEHVHIGNTNKLVLDWIESKFGGNIRDGQKRGTIGKTGVRCNNDSFVWELNSYSINKVLSELVPYLKVKKEQAEVMINYLTKIKTNSFQGTECPTWYRNKQKDVYIKLKTLNKTLDRGILDLDNGADIITESGDKQMSMSFYHEVEK